MKDNPTKLTISIAEAALRLGIGRNQTYAAARKGEIPTIRIGNRYLVPVAALERMLASATAGGNPPGSRNAGAP